MEKSEIVTIKLPRQARILDVFNTNTITYIIALVEYIDRELVDHRFLISYPTYNQPLLEKSFSYIGSVKYENIIQSIFDLGEVA